MSTFIVIPQTFTIVANSAYDKPPSYLLNDEPGLVWKTTTATSKYVTVQLPGSSVDVIAFAGTNLAAGDAIRVRMGASTTEVNGSSAPVDVYGYPLSGTAPNDASFVVVKLASPVAYSYMRIDIPTVAAGYFQASRLVVGKAVEADGLDTNAEITFDNPTVSYLDPKSTKPTWKVTLSGFTDATFWSNWAPALRTLADKRGFLFVPNHDDDYAQEKTVFGYVSTIAKGTYTAWDHTLIDITVQSLL